MPLTVLPALIPDIDRVYDCYFEAFKDEKIIDFLFPGGVNREAHRDGTIQWLHHDRNGYTIKCVDSESGQIVGMSSWEVYWRPGEEHAWKKPAGAEWLTGKDRERADSVLVPLFNMREQLFGGRRHVYCMTVATHPDHRRRGVGRSMMKWGMDIADQLGLPIYLESTTGGVPLYQRLGFETLTHVSVIHKAEVIGEENDVEVPLMVKMPSKAKGICFKEWAEKGYPENY